MPATSRFILLFGAALCGGYFWALTASYALIDDPEGYSGSMSGASLFLGAMYAGPYWVPAIIPSRYPVALSFFRRAAAAVIFVFTFIFGTILWHNIGRIISGSDTLGEDLAVGAILTTVSLASLMTLMKPDLPVFAKRAAKPADSAE